MAGDWIKWVKGLTKRREVAAAAHKLGVSRRELASACMELWEWADENTTDGHVRGMTAAQLDELVQLNGFVTALSEPEIGWIRVTERGISFPNFDRHNGETAKRRALANNRQRRARVTKMSRKHGDESATREEKNREEKNTEKEPTKKKHACTTSQAETLYSLYPRRVGKPTAIRAIVAAADRLAKLGHDDPVGHLQDRVYAYAKSPAGQRPVGDDDYRPHPSTWFNQGRYDDDPAEWQRPNGGAKAASAAYDAAVQKVMHGTPTLKEIRQVLGPSTATEEAIRAVFEGDDE